MAFYQLLQAGPKFMQQIHSGIIADRRTKIAERRRNRAVPVRAVGGVNNGGTQYSQKIRSVQPAPSGVVLRNKDTRSRVGCATHQTVAIRRMIIQVSLQQCGIQMPSEKIGLSS